MLKNRYLFDFELELVFVVQCRNVYTSKNGLKNERDLLGTLAQVDLEGETNGGGLIELFEEGLVSLTEPNIPKFMCRAEGGELYTVRSPLLPKTRVNTYEL